MEYTLTAMGESFLPVLNHMLLWAKRTSARRITSTPTRTGSAARSPEPRHRRRSGAGTIRFRAPPACRKSGSATFSRKTAWRKGLDFQQNSRHFRHEGSFPRHMSPETTDFCFIPAAAAAGTLRGFPLREVFDRPEARNHTVPGLVSSLYCLSSGSPSASWSDWGGAPSSRAAHSSPPPDGEAPSLLSPRDPLALGSRGDPETAPNA